MKTFMKTYRVVREESYENMVKQYMNEGFDESTARELREYREGLDTGIALGLSCGIVFTAIMTVIISTHK